MLIIVIYQRHSPGTIFLAKLVLTQICSPIWHREKKKLWWTRQDCFF